MKRVSKKMRLVKVLDKKKIEIKISRIIFKLFVIQVVQKTWFEDDVTPDIFILGLF